jgi:arylsulfatase A-like enzyme
VVQIEDDYGEIGSMTRWSSQGPCWANVSNTPYRFYKNFSYEGGINTPLIACWPGRIKPGTISRFPGHFIDIMATLVEITGAEYPESWNGMEITPLQGESLLPAFREDPAERERPLYWEWRAGQAILDRNWKLVREGLDREWDLYDMENDRTETRNLAPEYPELVRELGQKFNRWKALNNY